MSKKRQSRPSARPSIHDRIALRFSLSRYFDGIWIGSLRGKPEDLARVEEALLLIGQHSPLNYARIARELDRIWVALSFHGLAYHERALKACVLDERFLNDPATTIARIASTIVHEATHARLERYGIEYGEELRTRIEAICFRRELAFAVRLPDSTELQQEIGRYLEWYPANPDLFSDAHFRETHISGGVEALRYLGTPDWFIRALLVSLPMVRSARRFFSFAWLRTRGARKPIT